MNNIKFIDYLVLMLSNIVISKFKCQNKKENKKNKNLNLLQTMLDTCWFNCLFNQFVCLMLTDIIADITA